MNDTLVKKIAKIERTFLGFEDHGIFTAWLTLDYGSSSQGAGMMGLSYRRGSKEHVGAPGGIEHIIGILGAAGVDTWEQLKGRTVYAIMESEGYNSKIIGLAPLPTEHGEEFLFNSVELWPKNE